MPSEYWIEASSRDRRIRCRLGAAVFANPWSSIGSHEVPIWLRFAGTKSQVDALYAHLRSDGLAAYGGQHLKASGQRFTWRRDRDEATGAVVVTAYQAELVRLDPVAELGDVVGGVTMIPCAWLEKHAAEVPHDERQRRTMLLRAMYLIAHVDRRTRWPIPRNPKFLRRLARSLYDRGAVAWVTQEREEAGRVVGDLAEMGIDSVLSFCMKDEELGDVIRAVAKAHPEDVSNQPAAESVSDGETRIPSESRLLPGTDGPFA